MYTCKYEVDCAEGIDSSPKFITQEERLMSVQEILGKLGTLGKLHVRIFREDNLLTQGTVGVLKVTEEKIKINLDLLEKDSQFTEDIIDGLGILHDRLYSGKSDMSDNLKELLTKIESKLLEQLSDF